MCVDWRSHTTETARDQLKEQARVAGEREQGNGQPEPQPAVPAEASKSSTVPDWGTLAQPQVGDWEKSLHYSEQVLLQKLVETSRELLQDQSTGRSLHLCQLVSALASALSSIHGLREARPTLVTARRT